jgi:hypothetical protein
MHHFAQPREIEISPAVSEEEIEVLGVNENPAGLGSFPNGVIPKKRKGKYRYEWISLIGTGLTSIADCQ